MMEKISDITRNKIKDKSAAALPDNPSEAGYTAEEIKNAFIAPITDVRDSVFAEINRLVEEISSAIDDTWKRIYPIGYIYQSTNAIDPARLFGGTWQRFGKGRVLVGVDENDPSFNAVQNEGGEKAHTLTVAELAAHSHVVYCDGGTAGYNGIVGTSVNWNRKTPTEQTGGNQAHNNMQPYITVYMWVRTA